MKCVIYMACFAGDDYFALCICGAFFLRCLI